MNYRATAPSASLLAHRWRTCRDFCWPRPSTTRRRVHPDPNVPISWSFRADRPAHRRSMNPFSVELHSTFKTDSKPTPKFAVKLFHLIWFVVGVKWLVWFAFECFSLFRPHHVHNGQLGGRHRVQQRRLLSVLHPEEMLNEWTRDTTPHLADGNSTYLLICMFLCFRTF